MKRMRISAVLTSLLASICVIAMGTSTAFAATLNGADYSGWQSSNAPCITARGGAEFGVVKLTQGTSYKNYSAASQLACLRATGQETGVYHYAAGGNAESEARFFVSEAMRLGVVKSGVLALDFESNQNSAWGSSAWIDAFVTSVHEQTGIWPIVYIQASATWMLSSYVRQHCALWIAQYASNAATGFQSSPWNLGAAGESLRQYSSSGYVAGIGPLDLNIFRGSRAQWRKLAMSNDSSPVTPAPTPSPTPAPSTGRVCVTVRSGDMMSAIAARNGGSLSSWTVPSGNLNIIYPGQVVCRGGSASTASKPDTSTRSVVVMSGDTMSRIAARTGLYPVYSWRVPSGNLNRIFPGQVVTFGGSTSVRTSYSSRAVVVMRGNTASGIASRLGISWTQLRGMRSGNANLIYPGEVLYY